MWCENKALVAAQSWLEIDFIQAWWLPYQYVSIKPDGLHDSIACIDIVSYVNISILYGQSLLDQCASSQCGYMTCASYQAWMATACGLICIYIILFVFEGMQMTTWLELLICICVFVSSIVNGRPSLSQWEWYGATYKHAAVGASYSLVHSFGATCGVHVCMELFAWFHLCCFCFTSEYHSIPMVHKRLRVLFVLSCLCFPCLVCTM